MIEINEFLKCEVCYIDDVFLQTRSKEKSNAFNQTHFVTVMSSEFTINLTGLKQLLWQRKCVLISYYTKGNKATGNSQEMCD